MRESSKEAEQEHAVTTNADLSAAQRRKVKDNKKKPMWALTDEAREQLEDDEIDGLMDFAAELDIDKYLDDLEGERRKKARRCVRAVDALPTLQSAILELVVIMSIIHNASVVPHRRGGNGNRIITIPQHRLTSLFSLLRSIPCSRIPLVTSRDPRKHTCFLRRAPSTAPSSTVRAAIETVKKRIEELDESAKDEESSMHTDDLMDHALLDEDGKMGEDFESKYEETKKMRRGKLTERNVAALGGPDAGHLRDDGAGSVAETVRSTAESIRSVGSVKSAMSDHKSLRSIHSHKSLAAIAAKQQARLDAIHEEREANGPAGPRIVLVDDGGGARHRDDPSNLPYMHRNPAV